MKRSARKKIVDLRDTSGAMVYRGARDLRTTCFYELLPDTTGGVSRSEDWERMAPGRGADGDAGTKMLQDQIASYMSMLCDRDGVYVSDVRYCPQNGSTTSQGLGWLMRAQKCPQWPP